MALHHEIRFEDDIVDHLSVHGWTYAGPDDWRNVDRGTALYPSDLAAWVAATQPKAWDVLLKNNGSADAATVALCKRLRDQLDARGTLDVLRHGIDVLGLQADLQTAQFKPALAVNEDIVKKYDANVLRIVRQVNDLFTGEGLGDQDKLFYVNGTLKGKLLESVTLQQQAANNSKEQFGASPDLSREIVDAIMASFDVHTTMSTQALNSKVVQEGIKDTLLNEGNCGRCCAS